MLNIDLPKYRDGRELRNHFVCLARCFNGAPGEAV